VVTARSERSGAATNALPRRARRPDLLPYLFVAPIGLLLLAICFYPSLYAVRLALTDASLLRLQRMQFTGLQNVTRLLGDTVFLQGLWRTLRWDLVVVLAQLLVALPIALFLNRRFRGRDLHPALSGDGEGKAEWRDLLHPRRRDGRRPLR